MESINEFMEELDFKWLKTDAGLFLYRKGREIILAIIYVDDAQFCGPSKALVEIIKAAFMKKWKCHDLGETTEFLNILEEHKGHTAAS